MGKNKDFPFAEAKGSITVKSLKEFMPGRQKSSTQEDFREQDAFDCNLFTKQIFLNSNSLFYCDLENPQKCGGFFSVLGLCWFFLFWFI